MTAKKQRQKQLQKQLQLQRRVVGKAPAGVEWAQADGDEESMADCAKLTAILGRLFSFWNEGDRVVLPGAGLDRIWQAEGILLVNRILLVDAMGQQVEWERIRRDSLDSGSGTDAAR